MTSQVKCPLHYGIRECKCKVFENECGIRIEVDMKSTTEIIRAGVPPIK